MSETVPAFDHKAFLQTCTPAPGVYQMLDDGGTVLYVGKANSLRKRIASYFRTAGERSPKTRAMVAQIADIRVAVTHTEAEALLLEANLIKRHRPRYNVLLRDDKSYPYIFVSSQEYPRLGFHRGVRKRRAFAISARTLRPVAVRESLERCCRNSSSGPPVRGQRVRASLPSLPAVPDRALHGALRRADRSRPRSMPADVECQPCSFLQGKQRSW
jgi:hypothetical protein